MMKLLLSKHAQDETPIEILCKITTKAELKELAAVAEHCNVLAVGEARK
jgi:hypothetical protein